MLPQTPSFLAAAGMVSLPASTALMTRSLRGSGGLPPSGRPAFFRRLCSAAFAFLTTARHFSQSMYSYLIGIACPRYYGRTDHAQAPRELPMSDEQKLRAVTARLERSIETEVRLRRSGRGWFRSFMALTEGIGMGGLCLWAIFKCPESAQGYVLVGVSTASVLAMMISKYFQEQAMNQLRIDLERMGRHDQMMMAKFLEQIEAQHANGEAATAPQESTH